MLKMMIGQLCTIFHWIGSDLCSVLTVSFLAMEKGNHCLFFFLLCKAVMFSHFFLLFTKSIAEFVKL